MKVTVAGEVYSENIGDPILCRGMGALLNDSFDNAEINYLDISGRVSLDNISTNKSRIKILISYFSKLIPEKIRFYLKKGRIKHNIIKKIHDTDLIIIAGGQLLMNRSCFPEKLNLLVKTAYELKVPVTIFACGSYDKWNYLSKNLFKEILNKKYIKYIGVRDYNSRRILKEVFNIDANINIDPAFAYPITSHKSTSTKYKYGFVLTDPFKASAIRDLSKNEIEVMYDKIVDNLPNYSILFTTGEHGDRNYLRKYAEKKKLYNAFEIDQSRQTIENFVEIINNCDIIISTRLHPVLIALRLGKKVIALGGDNKIESVMDTLNVSGRLLSVDEIMNLNFTDTSFNELLYLDSAVSLDCCIKEQLIKMVNFSFSES